MQESGEENPITPDSPASGDGILVENLVSKTISEVEEERVEEEEEEKSEDKFVEDEGFDLRNTNGLSFAMEHRIFLKAVLDLLTERDRHAPELGMMDPNILKSGSLKKSSHLMNGVWKVKFVEIRRGMFSYYENAVSKDGQGELLRKNIPLEAQSCTCRPVKLHQKALTLAPGGAIFELNVSGTRRLWMANTREERQVWIQAINNATVGGSVTGGDSTVDHRGVVRDVSPRSPFRFDLLQYLRTQGNCRNAKSSREYVAGLKELADNPSGVRVPVKWVAKQGLLNNNNSNSAESVDQPGGAFHEVSVTLSVDQLWRDIQRDRVSIDGELFRGDNSHGTEKIIGALTRRILGISRCSGGTAAGGRRREVSESQALAYARDILLAGGRTRSGGDSYFCINTLCRNEELVVVVPSGKEADPISIEVSEDEGELSSLSRLNDKSGWIKTRVRLQRTWKKLFFVLSEGTLSFYERASPRPHGLRGQLVLTDVSISLARKQPRTDGTPSDQFVLSLTPKEAGITVRYLLFNSEERLLDWTYALECSARLKSGLDPSRKPGRRKGKAEGADAPISMADVLSFAGEATKAHATDLGLNRDRIENRIAIYARKTTSMVQVCVRAMTEYNICTTDPQGDEREDTWAAVRGEFVQSFRVSGGPNGRITRGEAIVQVSIADCIDLKQPQQQEAQDNNNAAAQEDPGSPSRRGRNRRIFRNISSGEGEVEETLKGPPDL